MNLKQKKKEKSIALKAVQEKEEDGQGLEAKDDQLALLTKNFNKFLKNMGKQFKYSPNFSKGDSSSNLVNEKEKVSSIWSVKDLVYIQSECANTLKKKSRAITNTQNDDEFDSSQEENESHVSNHVALIVFAFFGSHYCVQEIVFFVATPEAIATKPGYCNIIVYSLWFQNTKKGKCKHN